MKPALHFPRIGKNLLAAAIVAMFGIAGLPAEAKPKQASAAGKPIKGDINAAKALTFLYGNAKAKGRTQYATVRKIERQPGWDDDTAQTFAGKSARAEVAREARYTEQGKEKYLLITSVNLLKGNDCFACQPLTQGALFAKEGGQWLLEAQNKDLGLVGGYGDVQGRGGLKPTEIGRGKYGFLISGGAYRQDCLSEVFSIVMPYNGTLGNFGFDFDDEEWVFELCNREGYEPEAVEKCKGRKQEPTGVKESVDGGTVIGEINTMEGDEEYPIIGFWDGKLMTVDTGADYYDIVVQGKYREEICGPITWKTQRLRFANGSYKEVKGAK